MSYITDQINSAKVQTQQQTALVSSRSFTTDQVEFLAKRARQPENAQSVYEALVEVESQDLRLDRALRLIKNAAWFTMSRSAI